jgi:GNAT superfamily N-acetyltransferase
MSALSLPVVSMPYIFATELQAADTAELQAFFDQNPEYFLQCHGEPARDDEAATELKLNMPSDCDYKQQWMIGFVKEGEGLVAAVHVVQDLFADGVWHIGLFILETRRHGKGDAQLIYAATEQWALNHGARWLRLGAVKDNLRAMRFWGAQGYCAVRERENVQMGLKKNTITTMVKPLNIATLTQYLERVERDRT